MPAYRPDGVDKKVYDALKKKYKTAGRDSKMGQMAEVKDLHDAENEPDTDDEVEEFERKMIQGSKLDFSNLKPHNLVPYYYNKG